MVFTGQYETKSLIIYSDYIFEKRGWRLFTIMLWFVVKTCWNVTIGFYKETFKLNLKIEKCNF